MTATVITLPPCFAGTAEDPHVRACDLCGVLTREDFGGPAPECCARERWCCDECLEGLEAEQRHEDAVSDWDARNAHEFGVSL